MARIDDLLRLQDGWKEPEPLPKPRVAVLDSQRKLFRAWAAQVWSAAHANLLSPRTDGIPLMSTLTAYLGSVSRHFGEEQCRSVAVFHGLTGSTFAPDANLRGITHLDFPPPFNFYGKGGFYERTLETTPEPSSPLSPREGALRTPASLQ